MEHKRAVSPLLATIILIAITIVGGAVVYVVFLNRSDVAGDVHSIQVENAQLVDPAAVNVTVDSTPSGVAGALVVDGVTYTGPVTFTWQADTQHSIDALSPIGGYTFVSWSDGNGQSHTIWTDNGNANYTATYGADRVSG
jgi:flagellin-like protein